MDLSLWYREVASVNCMYRTKYIVGVGSYIPLDLHITVSSRALSVLFLALSRLRLVEDGAPGGGKALRLDVAIVVDAREVRD
jgi:hypothetical protein